MSDYDDNDPANFPEIRKYSPFVRFAAILTAIALFLLSLEGYFYLIHPEPVVKLALADVQEFLPSAVNDPFSPHRFNDIREVLTEANGAIKQIANKIAADSCRTDDRVCQSKALFYFVRDRIRYVPDDRFHDELENPVTVLKTGGADCEDMAVLLIGLQKAIGNQVRLVFVPGHAYAQVKIPDYKNRWLNMEATCKTCQFDDIPTDTQLQPKEFFEL